ncbi:MAG: T9SS type A sorting domain-containing protein [Gemmatimonadota bacterium]|nr:MAG: T9SS type A sorting domain-containing protein [Gemmatimonadota bacterium]
MNVVQSAKARWAIIVGLSFLCVSFMANVSAADPTWEVGIEVSSSDPLAGLVNLTIGVDPAADDGLDSLDVQSPPPTPPPHKLDVFFLVAPYKFWKDIRPDVDIEIVWQGAIISDSETYFFAWDPAALPDTGNFMFNDTVDMRTVDSQMVTGTLNPISGDYEYGFTITRSFVGELVRIEVTPEGAQVVCGANQQYTAQGFDEFDNAAPTDPVWSVAPATLGTIDVTGMFTADQAGQGWIIATDNTTETTIVDSAAVTVTAGELDYIDVTPDDATVASGSDQQYTATGYDACDNALPVDVDWEVHPADLGTIDEAGLFTAVLAGEGWIVASTNPVDSAFVTVVAGPSVTMTIAPDEGTVTCPETIQFTASGVDANGNPTTPTPDWSVSPTTLGTMSVDGLFTPGLAGSGWVIATLDGLVDSAAVTVNAGDMSMIVISPDPVSVACGAEQQFAVLGDDGCGNPFTVDPTWSVSPATLGTITEGGVLVGDQVGSGWVIASAAGFVDSADVTVIPGAPITLEVSPDGEVVISGETLQYTAQGLDACGNEFAATPTWSVSPPELGNIDAAGLFTGIKAGDGWVIAEGSAKDSVSVTVVAEGLVRIDVTPASKELGYGQEFCFIASGFDLNDNPVAVSPTWSVTPPEIGTMNPATGCFTADSLEMEGWVFATDGELVDSAHVTIVPRGQIIGITVYPQDTTVASGQTVTYRAMATDGNVEWEVTDSTIFDATDSCSQWFNNIYQACYVGTWAVIGLYAELSDTALVHVTMGPIVGIEVTPETTVVSGSEMAYTAMAYDEAGNETDVTGVTEFGTTDPCGSFTDNVYEACQIGSWEISGTYNVTFTDAIPVTVIPFEVSVDLAAGWNMVSLSVVPDDYDVDVLFPGNVGAFGWNGSDYVEVDVFEIGDGYWLAVETPQTVVLSGIPVMNYTSDILAGWNMVGSIAAETDTGAFVDTPAGNILPKTLQWYDPALGIYKITGVVQSGKGYWLAALYAGTLTLSGEMPAAKTVTGVAEETLPLASVTVTKGTKSQVLEFGLAPTATPGFDRHCDKPTPPPSPMAATFEAYFASDHEIFDRYSRDVRPFGTTATYVLEVKERGEFTLDWDVAAIPPDLDVLMRVNDRVVNMRTMRSLTLEGNSQCEISVGKGLVMPSDFNLAQNYPNPFNPETEILYSLPQETQVSVTVYNVLGQVVKILVNEKQQAGVHLLTWDGRSDTGEEVASGIYFYQMQASDFTSTKRMVLMK